MKPVTLWRGYVEWPSGTKYGRLRLKVEDAERDALRMLPRLSEQSSPWPLGYGAVGFKSYSPSQVTEAGE